MHVSIVTALYNRLDLTRAFLASLETNPPSAASWEIIWVDDGSTDGTRDWLLTLPAPRHRIILNDRNLGYLLMRRWQKILPDLAAESWREVPLRDPWEAKLTGLAWLAARLTRRWHRHPEQTCPRWMKRNVTALVDRQLALWHRLFPEIKATSSR